ncbi:MAG: hypothetical protein ACYTEZ_10165 [Planctomycetota bacterium]|jgi:hypothetical protein
MRDRRDYAIAALAAAFLFSLGLWVGHQGSSWLPAVEAQDAFDPETPVGEPSGANDTGGGITIRNEPNTRPGLKGRTRAATASDSDSNNRFVAVTSPIGSGESVLFLIDSESEQIAIYRYRRGKGLEFLAGRKIEYDLRISGYQDISEFTHDEMKQLYQKQAAKEAAKALKGKK